MTPVTAARTAPAMRFSMSSQSAARESVTIPAASGTEDLAWPVACTSAAAVQNTSWPASLGRPFIRASCRHREACACVHLHFRVLCGGAALTDTGQVCPLLPKSVQLSLRGLCPSALPTLVWCTRAWCCGPHTSLRDTHLCHELVQPPAGGTSAAAGCAATAAQVVGWCVARLGTLRLLRVKQHRGCIACCFRVQGGWCGAPCCCCAAFVPSSFLPQR